MSPRRSMFDRTFATGDRASNSDLLTHYYRSDYNKAKECILEIAERMKYNIENVDDHYKEIYLSTNNHQITINLINLSYYEIAIDMTVNGTFFFGRNKAIKVINEIYQFCDRRLNFKGKGLYNEYSSYRR